MGASAARGVWGWISPDYWIFGLVGAAVATAGAAGGRWLVQRRARGLQLVVGWHRAQQQLAATGKGQA